MIGGPRGIGRPGRRRAVSEEKRQDDELVQQLKWYADQAQCPSEKMHWVLAFQEIEALQQRVGELENSEAASAALI